jgi:L-alanine-DL-glutamate epimerase-like enolase superfamily enzyme
VAYVEPNDFGATRRLCLVRITADDGQIGWGEAVTTWEEATIATCRVVDGLASLIIGCDPVETQTLWRSLQQHTGWYGQGGIACYAISAIDMAMWDLKGKALGQPLINLLGGAAQQRIPAIASAHAVKPDLLEIASEVASWMQVGFQGYKFGMGTKGQADLGRDHERDVAFVRAIREAIGPHRYLMADAIWGYGIRWDVQTAYRRIKAFEEYDLTWIEEPLDPDDYEGYRMLRSKTGVMLAAGEREWTVTGYERLLRSGGVDIVGVDPGRIGGITASQKVIERIEAARKHFNAHTWSSAINTAASLALSASTPWCLVFEVKPLRNPMQHELVATPLEPQNGWISAPTEPGLGIEVLDDVVNHYRLDR